MDSHKLMGFETPDDKRVPVPVRQWEAMKRALWRSKFSWDVAGRAAKEILASCKHASGCAAEVSETESCGPDCPDREHRLSALVILNAARQHGPQDFRRPADAPYYAPSREHFSEVLAELSSAQAELQALRGSALTEPSAQGESDPPKQLKEAT